MDQPSLPFSHDHAVFDFSGLPPSRIARGGTVPGPVTMAEAASDDLDLRPLLRKLFPWISAQVAVAIGLGTCLAQAMPPVAPVLIPADDMNFALRLGDASEGMRPVPSAIRDGFHLRFSSID
ncbi:hypothetical protein ASF49_17435 [Methylobacterium sp. Leaf104]|uniref:hypothetical protein n=1 Tax=Methylobacterium TaxID=407 RepID=UPI0007008461|nr:MULTISPECIES: hypothetical protein [Methylobacterium]KQP41164.1 hypothetical protein ASF49_17435 [Methylobacterium sp. Leaf104]MCI9879459.1 hypothetical protein [Methylobacterium goesingense]